MNRTKTAPAILQKPGRKFWKQILSQYGFEEVHHFELLGQACQCLDRIDTAQKVVEAEGSYFQDRFDQPKEHPGLKTERDNKILFARLVRELSLDVENATANRPTPLY